MTRTFAALIPAVILLLAILPMPYGYYTFLRVVITGWALFVVWVEFQKSNSLKPWSIVFLLVAALFNPVIPVHLSRDIWWFIDIGTALVFGAHAFVSRQTTSHSSRIR